MKKIIIIIIIVLTLIFLLKLSKNDSNIHLYTKDENVIWDNYKINDIELSDTLNITEGGIYNLTGEIEDGLIIINTIDNVKLILNDVTITNSNGPCIYIKNTNVLSININGNNTLTDSSYYSGYEDDVEGVIFSKDSITLSGDGTLNLNAKKGDALVSKNHIKILSGNYIINSNDDGIRGKDSVYIKNGDFNISSLGNGIKSTNNDGYIKIDNGNINIIKSYEGIEANNIIINDGVININSTDDGINASNKTKESVLTINGGYTYINASGDGIDSNGSIYINGGEVYVDGPTNDGDGPLDYDNELLITKGTLLAVGSKGMAQGISNTSTQNGVLINLSNTYSKSLKLVDSNNNVIISYTPSKKYSSVAFSSDKLINGDYTLLIDNEIIQTFTINDITTIIGSNMMKR